jgi:two-component sensor histidine kinase
LYLRKGLLPGLRVTELADVFDETTKDGVITVTYDVSGTDWQLAVTDNGSRKPDGVFAQPKTGLGTGVVRALAKQLDAQVVTSSDASGTRVLVTHATFAAA